MKDNNYSMVEGILYNYPKLKVEIDNLKIDLEEAQEIVGIRGVSGNEKAGLIQSKERQLRKVENILSTLTEYEMQLIEMRYFKRYSIGRICGVLELSEDGFNKRRKNIIIKRLMPLFVA